MSLNTVYLGLGSNIDRERHLCAGLDALAGMLSGMQCSAVFESQAVGIKSGPFYNLVVRGQTELPLLEFDRRLKFIEAENGRYAPDRKGLPLDIDVLMYGDLHGTFDGLVLPRAEILKNAFVLWPLSLLAPELVHPGVGKGMAQLWREASIDQVLAPVPFEWRGLQLTPA
ncbi:MULTISPECIES: 2-amino-4-hydroxy-6-hydroxymethyldihydropteridine diphosphokinase [Pseudomonas]|uniref:2-amino-4-hydroxy-6- hydroxymethyldihydropteridine diphosphokinase n=1 Tax=Pseudomonas TaxID=286 RepID=UPI001E3649E4|nr:MULTISPECIES: 2-amino-4-hydroxy-6-hydroxymethyldihydropteridine diphosphokinase [Pseudomonas]MCE1116943.1 2-amino-4-hydroxy-6-hydroxymethyldihydropteridine diphosphokinase [Pseudomonas sp. NMI795_08]